MIKSIVQGDYCLNIFPEYYSVTDTNGKLVFYYFFDDWKEFDEVYQLYPYRMSYDIDKMDNPFADYCFGRMSWWWMDSNEKIKYFMLMFNKLRQLDAFKYYQPDYFINSENGKINFVEFKLYLKEYHAFDNSPETYFKANQPYSLNHNMLHFTYMRAYILRCKFNEEFTEISREHFEKLIPNETIGSAYVELINENNKFYLTTNINKTVVNDFGIVIKTNDEVVMCFEVKK